MTRFWASTSSLEKAAWFFSPDGKVYQDLTTGLTPEDLAAHTGTHGTFQISGGKLIMTWSDGKTSESSYEPGENGKSFSWNAGIFTPVLPLSDPATMVVGRWEGGESLSGAGSSAAASTSYDFRADGTYTSTAVASLSRESDRTTLGGSAQGSSAGTWKAEAYSIVLTSGSGSVTRNIAFPYFEDATSKIPSRLYLGGLLLKR